MAGLVSYVIVIMRHSPKLPLRGRRYFGFYSHGVRRKKIEALASRGHTGRQSDVSG